VIKEEDEGEESPQRTRAVIENFFNDQLEQRDKSKTDDSEKKEEQIQSEIQRMEESRPEIAAEEEEKNNDEVMQENAADSQNATTNKRNSKTLHGPNVSDVHFESD